MPFSSKSFLFFFLVLLSVGAKAMRAENNVEHEISISGEATNTLTDFLKLTKAQPRFVLHSDDPAKFLTAFLKNDGSIVLKTNWATTSTGMGSRFFPTKLKTMSYHVSNYRTCYKLKEITRPFAKNLPQEFVIENKTETIQLKFIPGKHDSDFCLSIYAEGKEHLAGTWE